MDAKERIEESHGLWELAIVRLATLAEVKSDPKKIAEAVAEERRAFAHWRRISEEAMDIHDNEA